MKALLKPHRLLQAAITVLLIGLIVVLESKSALGAYHAQTDHLAGLQFGALSLISAIIAFVGFGLAGRMLDDYRDHVRRRAHAARIVSLAFLIIPIIMLGSSIKTDDAARQWTAYVESPAFAADQQTVADPMADRFDRQAAQARLIEPVVTGVTPVDGAFWIALFLQGLLIFASDALRVPAPMSQEEFAHLKRSNAAKKAAKTRKAKRTAKNVVPLKKSA